jgi:CBS domain-containing protein
MKGHARELMTHETTQASPETPLAALAYTIGEGRIGGVPIVDASHRVVGFVSETDVMTALLEGRSPETPAHELMTSPAETIDEFATTDDVISLLRLRSIHHLPVVRGGRLVGIISPKDVLRYYSSKADPEDSIG